MWQFVIIDLAPASWRQTSTTRQRVIPIACTTSRTTLRPAHRGALCGRNRGKCIAHANDVIELLGEIVAIFGEALGVEL